ncbi:MAG: hypothetical protein K8R68_07370, partial [Bacteroidales bacterium]|nr:hypothetical protein [Bacteroidales bacterium]
MKSRALTFLFLLVLQQMPFADLYSQSTYTRHISTVLDEYPVKVRYIEDGNLLLITHRGDIMSNYYDSFFSKSNILYKMDFELNIVDSLLIDTIGNYELLIKDIIKSDDNGMLLWANALDIATYDIQLCFIWLDNEFNIVNESIYGLTDMDEVISSHVINQNDQLVFAGSTDFEDYSGNYILWEFDLEGTEINKEIYTGPVPSPPSIIEIPGSGKYHINAWFDILQFDYNLNFETLYSFSDTIGVLPTGH